MVTDQWAVYIPERHGFAKGKLVVQSIWKFPQSINEAATGTITFPVVKLVPHSVQCEHSYALGCLMNYHFKNLLHWKALRLQYPGCTPTSEARYTQGMLRLFVQCISGSLYRVYPNFTVQAIHRVQGIPRFSVQGIPRYRVKGIPTLRVQGMSQVPCPGISRYSVQGMPMFRVRSIPRLCPV